MILSGETIEEFRSLYAEEFGEPIGPDEAHAMIMRLISLYELLLRPLPGEDGSPSDQDGVHG